MVMGAQPAGPWANWPRYVIIWHVIISVLFIRIRRILFRPGCSNYCVAPTVQMAEVGPTPPESPCHLSYFHAFFWTQGRSMTTLSSLARPFSLPPMRHWFFAFPHQPSAGCILLPTRAIFTSESTLDLPFVTPALSYGRPFSVVCAL